MKLKNMLSFMATVANLTSIGLKRLKVVVVCIFS